MTRDLPQSPVGGEVRVGIYSVAFKATVRRHVGVGMVGRKYRLEWVELADGVATISPYDERLFDGQRDALAAKRALGDPA